MAIPAQPGFVTVGRLCGSNGRSGQCLPALETYRERGGTCFAFEPGQVTTTWLGGQESRWSHRVDLDTITDGGFRQWRGLLPRNSPATGGSALARVANWVDASWT